jgi:hypothetical protein
MGIDAEKSSAARRRLTTLSRSFRGFTWSGASGRLGPLDTTNANGKNCVTKFTPRPEMTLVGLQGKLDREIKARVSYASMLSRITQCLTIVPSKGEVIEPRPSVVSARNPAGQRHFVHRNVRESTATFARRVCDERKASAERRSGALVGNG